MGENRESQLTEELQAIESNGISLWLEGRRSNSNQIAETRCGNEANAYMRDYRYKGGIVTEVRFDTID